MDQIQPFRIVADFEPRPGPTPYDPEPEAELSAMSVAMRRFRHRYFHSMVMMKAGEQEARMELAFEVMYVLNQVPAWLQKLDSDGEASLTFGGQGSERELLTQRKGLLLVYWFRNFFTSGDDSPRARVNADEFVREWRRLAAKVLDLLEEGCPDVKEDPEFMHLRAAIGSAR